MKEKNTVLSCFRINLVAKGLSLHRSMKGLFTYRAYGADTFSLLNKNNLQLLCKFGHCAPISHARSTVGAV